MSSRAATGRTGPHNRVMPAIDNRNRFQQTMSVRRAFGTFLAAAVITLISASEIRADSEIVIAIRYLQAAGTSHSHLYLYREDGKLLRQLTDDNSGQDSGPIFSPDGSVIVFTREKPNHALEFWSVGPRGSNLKNSMPHQIGTLRRKAHHILQTLRRKSQLPQAQQVRQRNLVHPLQHPCPLTNRLMVLSN